MKRRKTLKYKRVRAYKLTIVSKLSQSFTYFSQRCSNNLSFIAPLIEGWVVSFLSQNKSGNVYHLHFEVLWIYLYTPGIPRDHDNQ